MQAAAGSRRAACFLRYAQLEAGAAGRAAATIVRGQRRRDGRHMEAAPRERAHRRQADARAAADGVVLILHAAYDFTYAVAADGSHEPRSGAYDDAATASGCIARAGGSLMLDGVGVAPT